MLFGCSIVFSRSSTQGIALSTLPTQQSGVRLILYGRDWSQWLQKPLFVNHPRRLNLKAVCNVARDNQGIRFANSYLSVVLGVLRANCVGKEKAKTKKGDQPHKKKTVYTISGGVPAGVIAGYATPTLVRWDRADLDNEADLVDADLDDHEGDSEDDGTGPPEDTTNFEKINIPDNEVADAVDFFGTTESLREAINVGARLFMMANPSHAEIINPSDAGKAAGGDFQKYLTGQAIVLNSAGLMTMKAWTDQTAEAALIKALKDRRTEYDANL